MLAKFIQAQIDCSRVTLRLLDTASGTRAMRLSYLVPSDIGATLVARIAYHGAARAVVCCEQRGAPRAWSRQALTLLKRCAAEISLRRARRHSRDGAADAPTERHR